MTDYSVWFQCEEEVYDSVAASRERNQINWRQCKRRARYESPSRVHYCRQHWDMYVAMLKQLPLWTSVQPYETRAFYE